MSYLSRQTTKGGYAADEVMSALQKEIRRGNERDAYFWAEELASVRPHGKTMVWNRLWVIAHEDVGIADPQVAVYVYVCRRMYEHWKGEGGGACMALCNAVAALARASKTRQADSLVNIVHGGAYHPEIPDYALDRHTARGRKLGRGVEHWLDVGCALSNGIGDPYEAEARPYFLAREGGGAQGLVTGTTVDHYRTPEDSEEEERTCQPKLEL